jgi:UPF0716 protein FxsA
MGFIIIFILIAVPLAEIAIFIEVGDLIGLWPTLLTVVGTAVLGGILLRAQGFATMGRTRAALARAEFPAQELFDAFCLVIGGLLLLTPGFLTDTIGFLLLMPACRRFLRRRIWDSLSRHGTTGSWQDGSHRAESGPIIDADFEELDPPDRHKR